MIAWAQHLSGSQMHNTEKLSWIKKYKAYQFVISASGQLEFLLGSLQNCLGNEILRHATHEKAGIKME